MRFRWYGWAGIIVVVAAQVLLFLGQPFVGRWFTPVVWSGYILFADALVLHLRGESLLHDRPWEGLMLIWISVGCWLLFEAYNIHLQNWYYVNVPKNSLERNWAYF